MKKFYGFIMVLVTLVGCKTADRFQVHWIASTEDSLWKSKPAPSVKPVSGSKTKDAAFEILFQSPKQTIDGFGICFNELGFKALSYLAPEKRNHIIAALFDTTTGCKFNICRVPIGANDFALNWYSLNDSVGDYAMKNFSLNRDNLYLFPYIRAAQKYRPDLKLWGSPWSPPAWMKQNQHYACQSDEKYNNNCCPYGIINAKIIQDSITLASYANYFVKFVQGYRAAGFNLYAVHPQNEPYACQIFPSCLWSGVEMGRFIRDYLGPTFEKEQLNCEIWLGTINSKNFEESTDTVLTDPNTAKYVTGVGYQWDGKHIIGKTAAKYPTKRLMQTESECGNGSNDWKAADTTFSLLLHYLKAGANSYMYWNPVLDTSGRSSWGWRQNSLVTVDTVARTARFNPEYYVMKHIAHFVRPGAVRIETAGGYDDGLAFRNPDGEYVAILANRTNQPLNLEIGLGDKILNPTLAPKSFNTFRFRILGVKL